MASLVHHEFAEMTEYVGNIRKELSMLYRENSTLRGTIEKLQEELRLAKADAGAGPTVARPYAHHCAWCRNHQPPR